MLDPSGISTDLLSRIHIIRYMRDHFDAWLEFANGNVGVGLKDEELMFVSGTVKTSRWAVAAFHGDFRRKQGSVTGELGSVASLDFSVAISNVRLDSPYYRVGPPSLLRKQRGGLLLEDGEDTGNAVSHDQTIFLHYYKMKRRLFIRAPIQAAAGDHELPDLPPGSAGEGVADIYVGSADFPLTPEFEHVPERHKASHNS